MSDNIQIREYQKDIINQVFTKLKTNRRIMVQAPTGSGKTFIIAQLNKMFIAQNKRVWVLVHRKELIEQIKNSLEKIGLYPSVIQSDYKYYSKYLIQIASVQTIVNRLDNVEDPDIIICDEAHHSPANTYRKIYDEYPNSKIIGLTATPVRTNGEGFEDLFDDLILGPPVKNLISLGYLCKTKVYSRKYIDISQVKKSYGDFDDNELFEMLNHRKTYGDIVNTYKKYANGKKAVVFAINIEHSKRIVKNYNLAGIPAAHIDSNTNKEERDLIINDFRIGKILILSNVNIITEGFDVPDCECVQLVRPTMSLSLYMQMVGRGMRSHKDKEYVIILDHSDCVALHGFPDKNRLWTLSPTQNNNKLSFQKTIRAVSEKDGMYYNPFDVPHYEDYELVEIEIDSERLEYINFLLEYTDTDSEGDLALNYLWDLFLLRYKTPLISDIQYFAQETKLLNTYWYPEQLRKYGYLKDPYIYHSNFDFNITPNNYSNSFTAEIILDWFNSEKYRNNKEKFFKEIPTKLSISLYQFNELLNRIGLNSLVTKNDYVKKYAIVNPKFYLSNSSSKNTTISISISHNNQRYVISSGIKIPTTSWDADSQRLKTEYNESQKLNKLIDEIRDFIIEMHVDKIELINKKEFKFEVINFINKKLESKQDLVKEHYNKYLDNLKIKGMLNKSTLLQKKTNLNKLMDFNSHLKISEIDSNLFIDFENYLRKTGLKETSIKRQIKHLKTFVYNYLINNGMIDNITDRKQK